MRWVGSRRQSIIGRVGVLLLSLLLVAGIAVAASATVSPDHIRLSWSQSPQTTQTISWRTDSSISEAQLRLSPVSARQTAQYQLIPALTKSWQTTLGEISLHSVTLTGLKPGSRYFYQVGDGTNWSSIHQFQTAPAVAGAFKFLVMGDSQSLNYDVWRASLQQAARTNPVPPLHETQ